MSDSRPPSREGKRAITAWVDPQFKRRFDQMCLDQDLSAQDAIVRGIELMLEHHAPIAKAAKHDLLDDLRALVDKHS